MSLFGNPYGMTSPFYQQQIQQQNTTPPPGLFGQTATPYSESWRQAQPSPYQMMPSGMPGQDAQPGAGSPFRLPPMAPPGGNAAPNSRVGADPAVLGLIGDTRNFNALDLGSGPQAPSGAFLPGDPRGNVALDGSVRDASNSGAFQNPADANGLQTTSQMLGGGLPGFLGSMVPGMINPALGTASSIYNVGARALNTNHNNNVLSSIDPSLGLDIGQWAGSLAGMNGYGGGLDRALNAQEANPAGLAHISGAGPSTADVQTSLNEFANAHPIDSGPASPAGDVITTPLNAPDGTPSTSFTPPVQTGGGGGGDGGGGGGSGGGFVEGGSGGNGAGSGGFGSGGGFGRGSMFQFHGFNRGGKVTGPGTGTSDSIPARVSNGEFVMRASSVRKYGPGLLNALNKGAIDPKRAISLLAETAPTPARKGLLG